MRILSSLFDSSDESPITLNLVIQNFVNKCSELGNDHVAVYNFINELEDETLSVDVYSGINLKPLKEAINKEKQRKLKINAYALETFFRRTSMQTMSSDLALINYYSLNLGHVISATISSSPEMFVKRLIKKCEDIEALISLKIDELQTSGNIELANELASEPFLTDVNSYKTRLTKLQKELTTMSLESASRETVKKSKDMIKFMHEVGESIVNKPKLEDFFPGSTIDFSTLARQMASKNRPVSPVLAYCFFWEKIKPFLPDIYEQISTINSEHEFNIIFNPDIKDVVDRLEFGRVFSGELNLILISRLVMEYNKLSKKDKPNRRLLQGILNAVIQMVEGEVNMFSPDEEAFYHEVEKLTLFAAYCETNGQEKVAWLGSARSIFSGAAKKPGEGIYLNCDDGRWSPALNHAWLTIAYELGFKITVIEPQYPYMEEALLHPDPACYLQALANSVRGYIQPDENDPNKEKENHSQYHGGVEPTATMQEVLYLKALGCDVSKNNDGHICFSKPGRNQEHGMSRVYHHGKLKRTNSSPGGLDQAARQFVSRGSMFQPIKSSVAIRAELADGPDQRIKVSVS